MRSSSHLFLSLPIALFVLYLELRSKFHSAAKNETRRCTNLKVPLTSFCENLSAPFEQSPKWKTRKGLVHTDTEAPVQFDGVPLAGHVHLRANDPYDWLKLSSFLRKLLPEHRLETHRLLQRGGFIISHVETNEVAHAILRHGLILVLQGTFVEGERHLQSFSSRLLLLRSLAEKRGCPERESCVT